MDVAEKPTLVQLLNRHRVNMIRLARVTRVQMGTVRAMAKRWPSRCFPVLSSWPGCAIRSRRSM
jgi:hypothetical protein